MQTPTRGPRRLRTAAVAVLAAVGLLALAGCMKVDMDLTLSSDDTVSGSMTVAFSDQLAETMGMDPQALWDQAGDDIAGDLPDGSSQEAYADGEYTGTTVTFTDMPLEELAGTGTDELSVTRDGDEFVVQGTMDMSDDTGQMSGLPPGVADSFDVRVAVTFPGEVIETNGTVDGSTVEWRPAMGESTEIFARGEASGGLGSGGFPWWIIGAVLGIAVLALVAVLVVRSNRRTSPTADGTAAPGTATAGTAAPGTATAGATPGATPVPDPYTPGGTPPQPGPPLGVQQPPVAPGTSPEQGTPPTDPTSPSAEPTDPGPGPGPGTSPEQGPDAPR
ncbi:hypothetical protein GCM10009718_12650 [Isoptericola halotolerans]|uniref:LppM domain-containing protein n=1 Tax=Isoptericola halotolerans TaxID=300560 RepID=A0ABX1ZZD5_9MICO|nr:hypothetical protein [Isoptericola halotolerans]NOV95814.1 hypothetical protein [Isoptericola halotolerans]